MAMATRMIEAKQGIQGYVYYGVFFWNLLFPLFALYVVSI